MKRKEYDAVYLTNTPSFYKLNLCEALGKEGVRVLLVLYGYGSEAVNRQLSASGQQNFDYVFLHEGDSHSRSRLHTFWKLLRLMRSITTKRVLYAGWLAMEYNLYSLLSPRKRNVVISESRAEDVSMNGLRGLVKRIVIGRMHAALPSGSPHRQLFQSLGFKGPVEETGSVGLINRGKRNPEHTPASPLRFLYVGRLTEVKNLRLLVETFNENGLPLTIAGGGELEAELKAMAGPNIRFLGFVDNEQLGEVYQNHDIFILPSSYEPWGLVVEEALYWGLPVVASDKVGSAPDMVEAYGSGVIFRSEDRKDLQRAIDAASESYKTLRANVLAIDWDARQRKQIDSYRKVIFNK